MGTASDASARASEASAAVREFPLPVSPENLRRLQGAACIVCGVTGEPMSPAGAAHTISPRGRTIAWNVRCCPSHREAAQ